MKPELQVTELEYSQRLRELGVKQIKDFPGYFINKSGDVYSTRTSGLRKLKPTIHKGYLRYSLFKSEKEKNVIFGHRLVAIAFVKGRGKKRSHVNHKDGNKVNNTSENLEWCSNREDQRHSREVLGNNGFGIKNPNYGYRKSKFYPSENIRTKLIILGVPRYRHDIVSLGELLPDRLLYKSKHGKSVEGYFRERILIGSMLDKGTRYYEVGLISEKNTIDFRECETCEADARAKMLIYLLENKLITLPIN